MMFVISIKETVWELLNLFVESTKVLDALHI